MQCSPITTQVSSPITENIEFMYHKISLRSTRDDKEQTRHLIGTIIDPSEENLLRRQRKDMKERNREKGERRTCCAYTSSGANWLNRLGEAAVESSFVSAVILFSSSRALA